MRKVRAPPEKMPGNNRAENGNCINTCIILFLTESATENKPPAVRYGKGEKAR